MTSCFLELDCAWVSGVSSLIRVARVRCFVDFGFSSTSLSSLTFVAFGLALDLLTRVRTVGSGGVVSRFWVRGLLAAGGEAPSSSSSLSCENLAPGHSFLKFKTYRFLQPFRCRIVFLMLFCLFLFLFLFLFLCCHLFLVLLQLFLGLFMIFQRFLRLLLTLFGSLLVSLSLFP